MLEIFWNSAAGDILVLTLIGYVFILMAIKKLGNKPSKESGFLSYEVLILASLGIISLIYSFTLTGYSTDQSGFYKLVFSVHIFIAAWWLGQLFPLWLVTKNADYQISNSVLDVFGKCASVGVALLILCGLWMSYVLTGWQVIFSSDYLLWLVIKVGLVTLILAVATYHKIFLVPAILKNKNCYAMQKSILVEKIVAYLILLVTAYLTSFLGPPYH